MFKKIASSLLLFCMLFTTTFVLSWTPNSPYPEVESTKKVYYASFAVPPKTLDPAKSYDSFEQNFISQIYEPPLQYDYLIRPYKLVPLTASSVPKIIYYDAKGNSYDVPDDIVVLRSVYTIKIKPGIYYQPHPAFVSKKRELIADDYIYQIKRLANPGVGSPIYGLLNHHIDGFAEFAKELPSAGKTTSYIDLRQYSLRGVKKIDDLTFEITINGRYPQFLYWLATRFFSPIPWEVDAFYSNQKKLDFSWYPIGTGPFMLGENNPNSRMTIVKNPNYRLDMSRDGRRLPLLDEVVYTLEKETIPRWSKFLQGYYDLSDISANSFDEVITVGPSGAPQLIDSMRERGVKLVRTIEPAVYYLGFNMLDDVVGGYNPRARALRQAISIAVNYDEYIAIFLNGRGKEAQGPIPPGLTNVIMNPIVYRKKKHMFVRRSLREARALMRLAGYPGGRSPKTGHPLMLFYDASMNGSPAEKAQFDWMRKQFARIGIALQIRATQYNRFQEKIRTGNVQLFSLGWLADYPDPENFLFLLYGGNAQVAFGGENMANYNNPEFDILFDLMKLESNAVLRQKIINKMLAVLHKDAPWVWGYHTETLTLSQPWLSTVTPDVIIMNTMKYRDIDVLQRNQLRQLWNNPVLWPVGVFVLIVFLFMLPFIMFYRKTQNDKALRVSL